jgi:DNA-binding Xre family transcriptional regulator
MFKLKLKRVMFDKDINTRQLSDKTGIRWNTVDDMAENKSKTWSLDNLDKIMTALGIEDVNELIEYKKEAL